MRKKVYTYKYRMPCLTADVIVLNRYYEILLIRRNNDPFKGKLALPGGFINPNEHPEHAANRELFEETGIGPELHDIKPFKIYCDKGRDPRGWVQSHVYYVQCTNMPLRPKPKDDACECLWVKLYDIEKLDLAFDHKAILTEFYREAI